MDLENVSAEDFGRSLTGIGLNLISPDVPRLAQMLDEVFGLSVHRLSVDFAIVRHQDMLLQLHADGTYRDHPLLGMVPEAPPRGAGVQIYLLGIDPDAAIARAEASGHLVLEAARDKPHGLREGTVISPEGYAFSPAIPTKS